MHLWYIWFVYPLYASLGSAPQLLLLRAACQSGLSEEQPAESFRGSFTQCRSMDGCSYLPSCFIMAYVCFWKSQAHKFWDDSSQVLLTFCGTKKCSQASSSSRPFLARFFFKRLSDDPACHLSFDHLRPTIFAFAQGFSFHFNKLILLWPSWVATPARQNPKSLPQLSIISQSPLTRSMLRLARPCWTAQTWARRWVGPANCCMAKVLRFKYNSVG